MEKFAIPTSQYEVAEIKSSYYPKFRASTRPKLLSSKDSYNVFLQGWDMDKLEMQEQFKMLVLNRANRVLGVYLVSTGGQAGTYCDPKIIFGTALTAAGASIIVCHNHPSGNLQPSQADIDLTRKLKNAGTFLDITLLDHLIITAEGFYSFTDEGIL